MRYLLGAETVGCKILFTFWKYDKFDLLYGLKFITNDDMLTLLLLTWVETGLALA